jgi:hypothetical protein
MTLEELLDRSEPEPNTGCWLWTGPVAGGTGYGVTRHNGKAIGAHRLAFALTHGGAPKGKDVCHRCDVRTCINPAHLFEGTRAENLADMRRKGRANDPKGERHPKAKLDVGDVQAIRRSLAAGAAAPGLASRYGVNKQTIYSIKHGRSWKCLKEEA